MRNPTRKRRTDDAKLQTGMTVSDTSRQTGFGTREGLSAGRDTDISGMVSDYLSKDSDLMVQARTQGRQEAAQRGLLNSSMASGASADAMARQAVPIASQQANINTNANQRAFDRRENRFLQDDQQVFQASEAQKDRDEGRFLQDDQQGFQSTEAQRDRDQARFLQDDQQGFQSSEASKDRQLQTSLQDSDQQFRAGESELARQQELTVQDIGNQFQRSQAEFDAEIRTRLQQMDQDFQTDFQREEQGFQQRQRVRTQNFEREMTELNLSEQQRQQVSTMSDNAAGNYQNTVVNILGNPDMNASGRKKALNDARSTYQAQMSLIEDLYRVDLNYA